MKRVLLICALTLFWWQPSAAQSSFDFEGTWRLDPARSQSTMNDGIRNATMVISSAADAIRVDTNYDGNIVRTVFPLFTDEPQLVGMSWQASEGDPELAGHIDRWEGGELVTTTPVQINGMTVTATEKRSLNASGNELTVERTITVHHAHATSFPVRDVYVRTR